MHPMKTFDYQDLTQELSMEVHLSPLPTSSSSSSYSSLISNITNSSDTDDPGDSFHVFIDVVGIFVTGGFCLVGLAGNVLSVAVLSRTFSRSPMFYVLRVLSISDAAFLLSVFTLQTTVNIHPYLSILETCYEYRAHIQWIVWPITMATQMISVWLVVLVSCERYVAICYPLRAASICTIGKVRGAIAVIAIVSVLFNVPRYWEYTPGVNLPQMAKTLVSSDPVYRYLYTCVLYAIALFFLPLIALFFLNVRLVIALQRGKRQWQHLQFRQRREQNLTAIPLSIVCIFVICGTPMLLANIVDSVYSRLHEEMYYVALVVIANFLVVLNSAGNIVVYFLLGRRFRARVTEMLLWLFCCGATTKKRKHPAAASASSCNNSARLSLPSERRMTQTDAIAERKDSSATD